MSVSILGGLAKSHSLKTPSSDITRPTSVLLRRKLFDFKQDWDEAVFIDLCAGSGAMGFEAWSRGAWLVFLNDPNQKAFKTLQANQRYVNSKFELEVKQRKIMLSKLTAQKFLKSKKFVFENKEVWILVDPPYENHDLYKEILQILSAENIPELHVIIETEENKGPAPEELELEALNFEQVKVLKKGSHQLSVHRRGKNEKRKDC